MLQNTNQRATILGLFREIKGEIKKAAASGYNISDDSGKIHLLVKSSTSVPAKFEQLWKLRHGENIPADTETILQDPAVTELFNPSVTPRELRKARNRE